MHQSGPKNANSVSQLQCSPYCQQDSFGWPTISFRAVFYKATLLVAMELRNPSSVVEYWKPKHRFESKCTSALRKLLQTVCMQTKLHETCTADLLSRLHITFRHALFEMEAMCHWQVTGRVIGRDDIENWNAGQHKLCLLHLAYSSMEKDMGVLDVQWRLTRIELLMQSGMSKVPWSQLILIPKTVSVDCLNRSIMHTLRHVDATPLSYEEHSNMITARIILQRCATSSLPMFVALLVNPNSNMARIMQDCVRLLNGEKDTLGMEELGESDKRLVKYCIDYSMKLRQFSIRYACDYALKCSAAVPDHMNEDSLFVVCNYCAEMLTYKNISKRPPSFGPYLHTEMFEMRCFRCDSTDLLMVPCGDLKRNVFLELKHPDRNSVSFCQGQRTCFGVSGYPSHMCNRCEYMVKQDSLERFLHSGTCLDSSKCTHDYCTACKYFWLKDPEVTHRIRAPPQETKPQEVEKIVGSESSRKKFKFDCQKALFWKERKNLVK